MEIIETIYKQYMLQYEKYGHPPTRIILGVDVVREALEYGAAYVRECDKIGEIYCFGKPVTVDMVNPRLIHISKGEDYTVELENECRNEKTI